MRRNIKIYLIRHGETTGDIEDRYGGDYDDHLTEKGKQQSKDLADKLKGKGIQFIYNSSRIRATETAEIVATRLDLGKKVVQDIRERNAYGVLTGLTKTKALEKYPDDVAELKRDKINHHVKDSEDYGHFKNRIMSTFDDIARNDKYSTIAIITHGGPISCIVREVLKLGEIKRMGDCAIFEIELEKEGYVLLNIDNAELEK